MKKLLLMSVTGILAAAFVCAEEKAEEQPRALQPEVAFNLMAGNAERGDVASMVALGSMYEQGVGVRRNFAKALEWYEKAAAAGNAEAHFRAGICYEVAMGNTGDMAKAVAHFTKAGELSYPGALLKLYAMYHEGYGVAQDDAKAFAWLGKAAQAGIPNALSAMGLIHLRGLLGQQKNDEKAFDFFVRAAAAGSLDGICNLALIFKDGVGRKKDTAAALKWMLVATKGGYQGQDAEPLVKELKEALSDAAVKTAEKEADEWLEAFKRKAEAGNAQK